MNHEAKPKIAERLATGLKRSYGRDVLAVLLDGSVARGDDTEYSDMELRVITGKPLRMKNMSKDGYTEFVYRNLAIQLQFLEESEVHKLISRPSVHWPIEVWSFLEPTMVRPSPEGKRIVEGFKRSYDELTPQSFGPAVQVSLIWIWEMYGKAMSAIARKSRDVVWCTSVLARCAALSVALINRRYLHYHDSRCLADLRSFQHLPKNFVPLFEKLYRSNSRMKDIATEMWENSHSFAQEWGYPMKTYKTWDELAQTIGFK